MLQIVSQSLKEASKVIKQPKFDFCHDDFEIQFDETEESDESEAHSACNDGDDGATGTINVLNEEEEEVSILIVILSNNVNLLHNYFFCLVPRSGTNRITTYWNNPHESCE